MGELGSTHRFTLAARAPVADGLLNKNGLAEPGKIGAVIRIAGEAASSSK